MNAPRTPAEQTERIRNVLACALVGAFVGALIRFSFKEIPPGSKDIVNYMVGQLSGMALMALGFYFTNKAGEAAIEAKRVDLDTKRAETTREAFRAVSETAKSAGGDAQPDVTLKPGETAQAEEAR